MWKLGTAVACNEETTIYDQEVIMRTVDSHQSC